MHRKDVSYKENRNQTRNTRIDMGQNSNREFSELRSSLDSGIVQKSINFHTMRLVTFVILFVAVQAHNRNATAILNVNGEVMAMKAMCSHQPTNATQYRCRALGNMVIHNLIPGANKKLMQQQPARLLQNCADDGSDCGCSWTEWGSCLVGLTECGAECIETWGMACLVSTIFCLSVALIIMYSMLPIRRASKS